MGKAERQAKKAERKEERREKKAEKREVRAEKRENREERRQEQKEARIERRDERRENRAEFFDNARDSIGNVIDTAFDYGKSALNSLRDLDVRSIADRVGDRLKKGNPIPVAPLPDFSDVLSDLESTKIQERIQKLQTPIDSKIIAQAIADSIIDEVDAIILEETQYLFTEINNESGIFRNVIDIIDEGLSSESDKLRGLNYESRTPLEEKPILEPNDARHMLIQPDEKTGLTTNGKELVLLSTGELYTGEWHTERMKGKMQAFTGAVKTPESEPLRLLPKSEELEILEQVDLTPNPLRVETIYFPPSSYNVNDGSISLQIHSGVPPYNVKWTLINEDDEEIPLPQYDNKISLDNLDAGVYTAYVTDSSVINEDVDFREDLGTNPDYDSIDSLVNTILKRRSRYNLYTNGWEFSAKGLPYVGKYHLAEIPVDQNIEFLDDTLKQSVVKDLTVKQVSDKLIESVENIYDAIIGDNVKLGKFFKPTIKPIPISSQRPRPESPFKDRDTISNLPFGKNNQSGTRNPIFGRDAGREARENERDTRRGILGSAGRDDNDSLFDRFRGGTR